MRTFKEKEVPARVAKFEDKIICDLCKCEAPSDQNWETDDIGDFQETIVEIKRGSRWPGSGDQTKLSFDVCPRCFDNRVIPWFKEQGAEPMKESHDW